MKEKPTLKIESQLVDPTTGSGGFDLELKKIEKQELEMNIIERRKDSKRIFCIAIGWLTFLALVVLTCALTKVNLSQPVCILLGVITLQIFRMVMLVVRYRFTPKIH